MIRMVNFYLGRYKNDSSANKSAEEPTQMMKKKYC